MRMASKPQKMVYKPGEKVPVAGIYKVHHQAHRGPHEASFRSAEKFPACAKCGDEVRYELIAAAERNEPTER
jgi:hypothetical protein